MCKPPCEDVAAEASLLSVVYVYFSSILLYQCAGLLSHTVIITITVIVIIAIIIITITVIVIIILIIITIVIVIGVQHGMEKL